MTIAEGYGTMMDTTVGPAESDDYSQVHTLIEKSFGNSRLEHTMVEVTTAEDPNFSKGDLRVAKIGSRVVSMMLIIRRPLRIGSVIVNGTLVGPVATSPEDERRGYCSAVMRDGVQYMRDQGIDLTILWGHPWLYPHYGYSPAMMSTEVVIKSGIDTQPREEKARLVLRPLRDTDLQRVTDIYHGNTATSSCAETRRPTTTEWMSRGSATIKVLADSSTDEAAGYIVLGTDFGRPAALEVGVRDDEACEAVLDALLETATKNRLMELPCLISPSHPFAHYAFYRGGEVRISSGRGAGMAMVLNQETLLAKMEREFERRLSLTDFHNVDTVLQIRTSGAATVTTTLVISRGRVSTNTVPSTAGTTLRDATGVENSLKLPLVSLNPLVTGYQGIRDLAKQPATEIRGGEHAQRLINVLFPEDHPRGGHLPLVWE
ncbi:GNAT family N-acetyltransferase [Candidatus Bathyarchaeota archaeon]|nr:GNAT family N-acetyltransferase [Candidatus Bathyarchaeota archaeon]